MILCLIILIVGAVALSAGCIAMHIYGWDCPIWSMLATICGGAGVLVTVIMLIICPIQAKAELNTFRAHKEYVENYEMTSEYDTAAIVTKKIELNEWLYKAQYTKEHYPICSFFGDEVLDLEPIK